MDPHVLHDWRREQQNIQQGTKIPAPALRGFQSPLAADDGLNCRLFGAAGPCWCTGNKRFILKFYYFLDTTVRLVWRWWSGQHVNLLINLCKLYYLICQAVICTHRETTSFPTPFTWESPPLELVPRVSTLERTHCSVIRFKKWFL